MNRIQKSNFRKVLSCKSCSSCLKLFFVAVSALCPRSAILLNQSFWKGFVRGINVRERERCDGTIIPLPNRSRNHVFSWPDALRKNRQRNVRQRNNANRCLCPIPLPNIPLPVPCAPQEQEGKKMGAKKSPVLIFLPPFFCLLPFIWLRLPRCVFALNSYCIVTAWRS